VAFDLGASSGRAMLARFDGGRLDLSEVHRFANGPVRLPDGLHWDVLRLWSEVKQGLALAARAAGDRLAGLGVDTWGVDFALLDRDGALVGNPYCYRDARTDGMLEEAFGRVPRDEIFARTGLQFMQINSLYQLLSMVVRDSPALKAAETFLMVPDLFNYWLTGRKVSEFSIATTSQCYDPRRGDWATSLVERLGIPNHLFAPVVPTGTVLGDLLPGVAEEVGVGGVPVIAPACHDTGSAVAAVPAGREGFAYVSSGTWSLVGAELREPVIDERSLAYGLTNEGGVGGTFRFLKNVTGLWLVQECRRTWAREGKEYSYDDLTRLAEAADPLRSFVDPDSPDFARPGDLPARIRACCRETGQPVPEGEGAVVRCALESLALKTRRVLERLEEVLARRLAPIHVVGGGARNQLLNRFTAGATGRRVVAGPVEATAIGNALVQLMALGHVDSLAEGRQLVRDSFAVETYEPGDGDAWDEAYGRYVALVERGES
jgi:sugar (pentulose or hexulose) kinase